MQYAGFLCVEGVIENYEIEHSALALSYEKCSERLIELRSETIERIDYLFPPHTAHKEDGKN